MDKTIENRAKDKSFYGQRSLTMKGKLYHLDHPWIMGILNLGSDSFYDGGKYTHIGAAVKQCHQLLEEGADIIDLGPTSSRPGSPLSEAETEWKYLEPFLKELCTSFPKALFSVDTYHAPVARKSIEQGAHMINDISGGTLDPEMAAVIGDLKVPYVLTHLRGTPATMQQNADYENPVKEVGYFFSKQIDHFNNHGAINLILDVGFGFGKKLSDNYRLLNHLGYFKQIFDLPMLAGLSRKSMIYRGLESSPEKALHGTTAGNTLALMQGADFLRVHDPRPACHARQIATLAENYA